MTTTNNNNQHNEAGREHQPDEQRRATTLARLQQAKHNVQAAINDLHDAAKLIKARNDIDATLAAEITEATASTLYTTYILLAQETK